MELKGISTLQTFFPPTDIYNQYRSWHEVTFGMAMAIDTIQHPGVTDYRVSYDRTNNKGIWTWTRQLDEVSANDDMAKTRLWDVD